MYVSLSIEFLYSGVGKCHLGTVSEFQKVTNLWKYLSGELIIDKNLIY